ncbi:hypothetical protein BC936DRAFT_140615 [Jimgerdemannia flammicorona]|uniref:Protein kinase domain-containing protein n=1 Tax=Jimgerdemannia flammicorona TaxID=994334 RepID=A0A433AJF3_9FUNG|nr:hypothetical protein BC936DRAFT_140615 [Jimgerdemannia flammicorona]
MNLKNCNVVATFGTGEVGKLAYILMKKHDGDVRGSLANLTGAQLEEVAREVFGQMLDGVAYLHSNGIAHRDIKSKNSLGRHGF